MTDIEERANDNAMKFAGYNDTLKAGFEAGYNVGATDQQKIDIEKACEWIEHNYSVVRSEEERGGIMFWKEHFKKAMEE